MIKNMWENLMKKLDKKTSPDDPILTGRMVEIFFLRVLLLVLIYMFVNTFIIPLKVWQFIVIDGLIYLSEFITSLAGRKK